MAPNSILKPLVVAVPSLLLLAAAACGSSDASPAREDPDGASLSDGGGGHADAGGRDDVDASGDAAPPDDAGVPFGPRNRANVLFSGHSLLDNPVPDWVDAIASARGDTLGWEQQNVIGSPLRVRTRGDGQTGWGGYGLGKNRVGSNRDLLAELATPSTIPAGQRYDSLLVTERHDPLETVRWENTVGYLRHFHDRLAAHQGDARTYFYQVWPDIDKDAPAPWITYQTTELLLWECIVGKVNLTLEAESRPKNVVVVPGSVALARLVSAALADEVPGVSGTPRQKLDAIFSDNVHLTAIGQYFIAAVHYASLFGKPPAGADAADQVASPTAAFLEGLAWTAVTEYAGAGDPAGARPMSECRARIASEVCPAFYAIRNLQAQSCAQWAEANGPFRFPDPDLPLPAP